jgi:hypothetical protein
MAERQGLLSGGWDRVMHNKRYIIWFYLLNLGLAVFGASTFSSQAHQILDHSLQAQRLVHGFDLGVLVEMFLRPEFGSTEASLHSGFHSALLFLALTALFLPGVLQGYASTYRLPREDFFRACGRNLWRFIRLMIVAGIIMGAVAGSLFGLHGVLERQAAESANEFLLPEVRLAGLIVIFLIMASLRIWFDLAQTDVVLGDRPAVLRSIRSCFHLSRQNLGRLLVTYVVTAIAAAIILLAGLWIWMKFVPPASVFGAVVVSQMILFLLLVPRFWQRGVVVSFYLQNMVEPIAEQAFTPQPVAPPPIPNGPPEAQQA